MTEQFVRIAADGQGRDPLVGTYLKKNRSSSAFVSFSLFWVCLGFFGALASAVCANILFPDTVFNEQYPAPEAYLLGIHFSSDMIALLDAWFGHLTASIIGMLSGTMLLSIAGGIFTRKGVPTSAEPLYGGACALFIYLLPFDSERMWIGSVTGLICLMYGSVCFFRVLALFRGGTTKHQDCSVLDLTDEEWPIYTVLVPLYKEAGIVPHLVQRLRNIDYPHAKLDVKLLLEADDDSTLKAIEKHGIPQWMQVIIVPDSLPKTKPRACNHGLKLAEGEFLVIYDAEDQPDPDQLKKAVSAFKQTDELTACFQAALAFRNHDQNWLSRLFSLEYNAWFGRYLPGLVRLGSPVPLGGTSNHFRMEALKELDGWDPYNVTEDCDLGIRLAMAGFRTDILSSTTWEEANPEPWNWIRQRSRWIKGYMQTHLVWTRHPIRLARQLTPWSHFCLWSSVGSVALFSVLNPILWVVLAVYSYHLGLDLMDGYSLSELLFQRPELARHSQPMVYLMNGEDPLWGGLSALFFIVSVLLLLSNFFFIIGNVVFGRRPDQSTPWITGIVLAPVYWIMMSIAAWKAFWQLLVKPHYWEKTNHGLDE